MTAEKEFYIGQRVVITSNVNPDVMEGTVGVIDCYKEDGYGVAITGHWEVTGSDRGTKIFEQRVVWYAANHLWPA
jgi:hypothetical protein